MKEDHPLAELFRTAADAELANVNSPIGQALDRVTFAVFGQAGFGIIVTVLDMPADRMGRDRLVLGVGHGRPILNPEGEAALAALRGIGHRLCAERAPGCLTAIILHPAVEDRARAAVLSQEAAARAASGREAARPTTAAPEIEAVSGRERASATTTAPEKRAAA